MASELPAEIDCRRLIADGGALEGVIPANRMVRITGLFRPRGDAFAALRLARDDTGAMVLTGQFKALLEAQCQRCLEWMELEVSGDIELDVIDAARTDSVSVEDEGTIIEISGDRLDVAQLIEDEILLACPMVPMHNTSDCGVEEHEAVVESSETRRKPFADLAQMLSGEHSDEDKN